MDPTTAGERILTVPEELSDVPPVAVTGNEWVSLPEIDPRTGACLSCGVLSEAARALVEFTGHGAGPGAVLEPVVEVGGVVQPLLQGEVTYEAGWIPRWSARAGDGGRLEVTWLAPPGCRGFLVHLRLGPTPPAGARLGLRMWAGAAYRTIYNRRPLAGPHDFFHHRWTRCAVLEVGAGLPLAALALRGAGAEEPEIDPARRKAVLWAPAGSGELVVYCGLAPESDGAATTAVDLARRGFSALLGHATRWLGARDPLSRLPHGTDGATGLARAAGLAGDAAARLVERIRRNLWFALFFAHGRTLDGGRWVHLTSRSPRYYVSGAHWSRDSLLWAYPAVLELDAVLARELLVTAFERYTQHPGEHSQYLDGTILYPGWELDQAAAWPLALARYLRATGDRTILDEPAVRRGLEAVLAAAEGERDPGTGLIRTFLLPSDDPAQRPFVTYDNALYAQALAALAAAVRAAGGGGSSWLDPAGLEAASARTRRAVLEHCVVDGPFGPMFAWAVAGPPDPAPVFYDEPPGTLELLGPYGFARPAAGDPVDVRPAYENTVRWIHSPHNPYAPPPGRFTTPTCPHARHPWLLSAAAGLLGGRLEYLNLLAEAPLDSGFACETFDAETGCARTGPGFATCAGFVAWAALEALRAAGGRAGISARAT